MNYTTMHPSQHAQSVRRPIRVAGWLTLLVVLVCVRNPAAEPEDNSFRVGFSNTLFTDVNENDARAAVKAWSQTIARERNIPTDPEARIFRNTSELLQALRNKSVDAVGISTIEYAAVRREVPLAPLFITYNGARCREQYLLLVHRDSKLEQLADLRGKSLIFHANSRASLAQPWLDTLLLKAGGKTTAAWLGKITRTPKVAQVVLPVFFRQTDACVATRTELETMRELNPQIGQQLKILARSPEIVPSLFCFRADYASTFKEQVFAGLRELHKTPAGLQVLTIFQSEKVEDQPASSMDSALALLAEHAQLTDGDATNAPQSDTPPPPAKGLNP